MIYVDRIADYGPRGKWCHLISDSSTKELMDFAKQIGLKVEWVVCPFTQREHFRLFPGKRELAIKYGAQEVSYQGLVAAQRRRHMGEQEATDGE